MLLCHHDSLCDAIFLLCSLSTVICTGNMAKSTLTTMPTGPAETTTTQWKGTLQNEYIHRYLHTQIHKYIDT